MKKDKGDHDKAIRFLTMFLAVFVAFVILFSITCIADEADHDCTGEDCVVCHQINACQNILEILGLLTAATTVLAALVYIPHQAVLHDEETIRINTLVPL